MSKENSFSVPKVFINSLKDCKDSETLSKQKTQTGKTRNSVLLKKAEIAVERITDTTRKTQ